MPMDAGQIILGIVGTIAVAAAAYYTTYLLAKKSTGASQGRMIRVIDRFALSKDKIICVIEVAGNVYLVAFSGQSATLLDTVDAEAVEAAFEGKKSSPELMMQNLAGGWTALKNGWAVDKRIKRGEKPDLKETLQGDSGHLSVAQEEDALDVVYRKMQMRRARTSVQDVPLRGGRSE